MLLFDECFPGPISHLLCWVFFNLDPRRRRNGNGCSIGLLPDDILVDILSRLPAPTILQCRKVCRHWRRLTSSTYFLAVQAKRAPSVVLVQGIKPGPQKLKSEFYVFDANSKKLRSIPIKPSILDDWCIPHLHGACGPLLHLKGVEDTECDLIFESCGGMFLTIAIDCYRDIVFNPITGELQGVKKDTQTFVCGLYFHESTNEYNFLCVRRSLSADECFEYFSYNLVSHTVKEIARSRFCCWRTSNHYPVAFKQALYMIAFPPKEEEVKCGADHCCNHAILVFEMDSERMYTLPHPEFDECPERPYDNKFMRLFVHDGHLALCHVRDLAHGLFDIWILEDCENWRWVRKSRFGLQKPRVNGVFDRGMMIGTGCFMVSSVGKDELFIDWFSCFLLAVNLKHQTFEEIKLPRKLKPTMFRCGVACTSSLLTPPPQVLSYSWSLIDPNCTTYDPSQIKR